jgi:hypothetical protein
MTEAGENRASRQNTPSTKRNFATAQRLDSRHGRRNRAQWRARHCASGKQGPAGLGSDSIPRHERSRLAPGVQRRTRGRQVIRVEPVSVADRRDDDDSIPRAFCPGLVPTGGTHERSIRPKPIPPTGFEPVISCVKAPSVRRPTRMGSRWIRGTDLSGARPQGG